MRTFGAGLTSLLCWVVSQPIDIVQRSLPEPELLVLEAVEQIERDIVFRVRSRGRPRCPSCSGSEVSYHSTYVRRLRDLPWQGAAGAGPGEDSSPSLSQSALSTQDLCGAIARGHGPAGTRDESTDPDVATSRLCFGRIAGIESAAADGNDRQPRYDTPSGEVDVRPSPGGEGAGPGRRRLGLAEAAAVRDHAHGSRAATSGRSASGAIGGELCRVASPASWSGNDHT